MKASGTMRKVAMILACLMILSSTAFAEDGGPMRTNAYIARTWAMVECGEGGLLNIAFDISGMGKMDEIGATTAYLYEVTGTSERIVAAFSYLDPKYSDMMGSNSSFHAGNLPYDGTPGHRYYATVYYRAGNANGSGTTSYTTSTVTALK